MRKLASILTVLFLLTSGTIVNAQKFGYIDSQSLLKLMPETKTAQEQLEKEGKEMEDQLEVMSVEYNNKLMTYQENLQLAEGAQGKWSAAIRKDKESELMQLQERIQNFQGTAQETLSNRRGELYKPILEKIDGAIKKVSKANDFLFVFDVNAVIYYNPEKATDVLPLVKKELGLQ